MWQRTNTADQPRSRHWRSPRPSSAAAGRTQNNAAPCASVDQPRQPCRADVTPATSNRLPAAALRVLDAYAEHVLACPPSIARRGGVHILPTPRRGLPAWHGYTLPIVALSFSPGAVVACRTDLADQLRTELGSDTHQPYLDGPAFRRLWRAIQRCMPNSFTLAGDFRAADAATFSPSPTMSRAEHIPEGAP